MSKTVLKSKFSEWQGLDRISSIVHEMRHIFREIVKDDYGLDGEIEFVHAKPAGDGYMASGQIVKVQAKSGLSYITQDTPLEFTTPVNKDDLDYWSKSNFPILFIVYHLNEDKLYCKDVKAYIQKELEIFRRPYKIRFDKKNDEFNLDYFTKSTRPYENTRHRVEFEQRERLLTNLFRIIELPKVYHASILDIGHLKEQDCFRRQHPYVIMNDRLYTPTDIRNFNSPLKQFCDSDVEITTPEEFLYSPENRSHYVFFMNQLIHLHCISLKLNFDEKYYKYYFPRENKKDSEFIAYWESQRTKHQSKRRTCKYYEYGKDNQIKSNS